MKNQLVLVAVLLLHLILLTGCVSMGPEPAQLSAEVSDRVSEMQHLHQLTLESFFESERKRVDDFMENTWTPLFLKNFLGDSQLLQKIEAVSAVGEDQRLIVREALSDYLGGDDGEDLTNATDEVFSEVTKIRSRERGVLDSLLTKYIEADQLDQAVNHIASLLNAPDPGLLIVQWAEAAQVEIKKRRNSLMEPIDEAERTISAELAGSYAEIFKAQGVVTARLAAASKSNETQDRLMQSLGVDKTVAGLTARLTSVSSAVGNAISSAESLLGVQPVLPDDTVTNTATDMIKEKIKEGVAPESDDQ